MPVVSCIAPHGSEEVHAPCWTWNARGSGAYDDHAVQLVLALHEPGQDANEITADSAADAAVVHLEDFFFRVKLLLDKRVIDANLSELRGERVRSGRICGWQRSTGRMRGLWRTSFSITAIFFPCS